MTYDSLTILIPCHSLEDFPTDLGDRPAEGLLNAWAVLWHPVLLATAGDIPRWNRADDALDVQPSRLVVIPPASDSLVPSAWVERARREGMHVVTGISERSALVEAVLAPLDPRPSVDPDLVADFLAFGHVHLQTEVLTRHMRQFGNIDEEVLRREMVAAAKAAVSGDVTQARTHLTHSFERLLEARERFYPVDCYLIDLCLVIPRLAGEPLERLLRDDTPLTVLGSAQDWETIAGERPALAALLRERWAAGTLDLLGGEWGERCTPLLPLDVVVHEFQRGRAALERLFGKKPTVWGRRRYGVSPLIPQLLQRFNYGGSLHFVMDDGLYPDEEYAKLQWRGCDGSTVPAYSRIPLAGDSAAAFLRFPLRMSESMDRDHVAALVFARWAELKSPWLEDFRRAHRYAPVLGRFVTFEKFFSETSLDHRTSEFREGVYLSPFLVQAVARRESRPIQRYVEFWRRRRRFEALDWCRATAAVLARQPVDDPSARELEAEVIASGPDLPPEASTAAPVPSSTLDARLEAWSGQTLSRLAEGLLQGAQARRGLLVVNPLSFGRKVVVDWPDEWPLPAAEAPIVARQFDARRRQIVVQVPPCGYAWVAAPAVDAPWPPPAKTPLAEELLVRNEFLEVTLSEVTGGIAQVRTYGAGGNRLSQQLAWRFPREKSVTEVVDGESVTRKTWYTDMRLRESRVLSAGPACGEVETVGELLEPGSGKVLGTYRQTCRVWRGRPLVEVEVELGLERTPEGDPWTNYVATRFAWNDATLTLTRSLHETAQEVKEEQRLESPNYLELASDSVRTTLLTGGLTFHRLTGPRMLDTLLVTEGEQQRSFRFAIAVDQGFPLEAALDWESPPLSLPVDHGPPAAGPTAWLFQVGARNVQLRRVLPLPGASDAAGAGCLVRLQETEGRNRTFPLECCLVPVESQQLDLEGRPLHRFRIENGPVQISIAPYELCDVELRFA